MSQLEQQPAEEAEQIENIVRMTIRQMRTRYPGDAPALRGVHAKDHGCVIAMCKVRPDLPDDLRAGVFATPGQEYQTLIRFSNATVVITPDSPTEAGKQAHGSRGMAIKLMGVQGTPLLPVHGALTQDFLMVNHPAFPFANVEDYEAITRILGEDGGRPERFFQERTRFGPTHPMTARTARTGEILTRVRSLTLPEAYQAPPASPVDNRYFSASPLLFGEDRVMKISATPVAPATDKVPDLADADYLRKALHQRLTAPGASDVIFELQVQVRTATEMSGKIAVEIENASTEWSEKDFPFRTVATITIPPQDFLTEERIKFGEELIFTPWHGITEHQPLGGINRLRRAVYEASSAFRHMPKEPAHF